MLSSYLQALRDDASGSNSADTAKRALDLPWRDLPSHLLHGRWRSVLGMVREDSKESSRIELALALIPEHVYCNG